MKHRKVWITADARLSLKFRLQYIQDIQRLTLKVVFGSTPAF